MAPLQFYCINPCKKSFSSQRGLTKHQDTCTIYSDVTGADLLESVQMEESAAKRPRLQSYRVNNQVDMTEFTSMPLRLQPDVPVAGAPPSRCANELMVSPTLTEDLGRGKRKKRRTVRYIDPRPEPAAPLPVPELEPPQIQVFQSSMTYKPPKCQTPRNANGLFREYVSRPTFVPEEWCDDLDIPPEEDLEHQPGDVVEVHQNLPASKFSGASIALHPSNKQPNCQWFAPFLNATTFRLMHWFWSAPSKSISDLQALADNVLKAEDYLKEDLAKFNAGSENKRLDRWISTLDGSRSDDAQHVHDGWIQTCVDIQLPTRTRHASETSIPRFKVGGFHFRPIVEVIKNAFMSANALRFHYTPYRQFWQKTEADLPERVYDELFTGDAWLKLHEDIQALPRDPEDKYERVIAGLMFWSDSTHLTNFGSASLWPLYMFFGNQSKQERSKPSSHACYHVAYFPKLPDSVADAFKETSGGKLPTNETLTHCKRELMHAVLGKIFDDKFTNSCKEGLVIQCFDGVVRRVYPRIMTYSADYPEKALLASIKFLSTHPCPRCLIRKSETHRLGSKRNEAVLKSQSRIDSHSQQISIVNARGFIYREGRGVKSAAVEAVLSPKSLVPTLNAFSRTMFPLGYNFYQIFVVDFLHEFELGLWKLIFIHLIRILSVCGQAAITVLNERYRLIATFGRDTIRRFTSDAASMKRMAARDYEDLLLCSIPVFQGLFPPLHDAIIQSLLFSMATWHALAKLRLQTDTTVKLLDTAKHKVSKALQKFQDITCQAYETRELPSEQARREKREARDAARKEANTTGDAQTSMSQNPEVQSQVRKAKGKGKSTKKVAEAGDGKSSKRKRLNLNTYKVHAPEHYAYDIHEFGALDSYSTQIGELEHRAVKKYYSRTNKRHAEEQITRIERREHVLRQIAAQDPTVNSDYTDATSPHTKTISRDNEEHHHISNSRKESIHLTTWLRDNIYDPATKAFQRKLKNHLLERLLKTSWEDEDTSEYTDYDRNTVGIEYSRLYVHRIVRVNYTTYDGQRNQDTVNPRTRPDVMLLAPEDESNGREEAHPYRYARVMGIFHAIVRHKGPRSTTEGIPLKFEFLWVRWFALAEIPSKQSTPSKSLQALTFLPSESDVAFGFLDPSEIIRGIHLIPAFMYGKTGSLLCHSIARKASGEDEDWKYYYINRFVDRDMYMRYIGGGVGHALLQLRSCIPEAADNEEEMELDIDPADPAMESIDDQRRVIHDLNDDEVLSIDDDRDDNSERGTASEDDDGDPYGVEGY